MAFLVPLAATALGADAATAATLGTVASIGGTVFSALGAISSGISQSKSADYNAQIALNNAKIARNNASLAGQKGEIEAAQAGAQEKAKLAAIQADQGASGVDVNSGSAVNVRSSTAQVGEQDILNIRANAARNAYGYETEAQSDTAQAGLYKSQASSDMLGGFLGGASSFLSGVGSAGSEYANYLRSGGLGISSGITPTFVDNSSESAITGLG